MLWEVRLRTKPAVRKKRVSAAEQLWFKLLEGNVGSSALMLAEPNGGMLTRNWSSIVVTDRPFAAIAGGHLALVKTAPGNIAPTPATLQIAFTEVNCNDQGTTTG